MSNLLSLPNAQRVLQIIHVSDMHVVAAKHSTAPAVRKLLRNLKRTNQRLYNTLRHGTATSDTFAPIVFRNFVDQITVNDPDWSGVETWIIDTGDHSTYGDPASLSLARQYLSGFASKSVQSGFGKIVTNIHGNHDAWPDDLPLTGHAKISHHTRMIWNAPYSYAIQTAQAPIQASLPVKGAEIQLYTIDTVNDSARQNMLAKGYVNKSQLVDLQRLIQSKQGNPHARHLRILATHHPIHYPPPSPRFSMKLANSHFVGYQISNNSKSYIHLVLSGHTHALYPDHGNLPSSPRVCLHDPLDDDQCQLVVGSLMQVDCFMKRWPHAHQCQVFRFYQDPDNPHIIILNRLLAARAPNTTTPQPSTGGIGPYKFIKLPGQQSYEEEMTIAL